MNLFLYLLSAASLDGKMALVDDARMHVLDMAASICLYTAFFSSIRSGTDS